METLFDIQMISALEALSGGLFISSGEWIHTTRQIDSFEIVLVREGTAMLFEEDKVFNVDPGEMLLLFPGRTHGGTEIYSGKLSFYWLHFKIRNIAVVGKMHHIKLPQHIIPTNSHRLNMLFRQYLNDQDQGILTPLQGELLVLQILSEALQVSQTTNRSSIVAEQVFQFIAEHYSEPISTSSIAGELHRNPDYVGRCFKNVHGCTITEEVNRRRLLQAEKLLIDTNLNLNEIAFQCGFNDSGYFRKLFIRKNDITPGKFRQNLSRIHINTI